MISFLINVLFDLILNYLYNKATLNEETVKLLRDLLTSIIRMERKIFNLSKTVNPQNFFNKLNKNDKAFLKEEDLKSFFEENNFYVIKEDLKFLLHRFDGDQDGRISYHEFISHFG